MKRELDIAVISDIHLGTYGCHAKELLNYLKSIQPRTLILNATYSTSGISKRVISRKTTSKWCVVS